MTVKEFNLMERREETFERMAFKLAEERELLIEGMRQMVDPCDFCEFGEEQPECEEADYCCMACKNKNCSCNNCKRNCNFVFSPERAKRILKRDEGK